MSGNTWTITPKGKRTVFTIIKEGIVTNRPEGISDEHYDDLCRAVQGIDDYEWYEETKHTFSAEEVADLCESPQDFINTFLLSERPSYMSQERFDSLRGVISSLPNNIKAYMTVEERRAWVVGGVAGSAAGGIIGSVAGLFTFDKAACVGQAVGAHDALTICDRGTRHVGTLRLGWSSGSSAGALLGTGTVSSKVGYVAGGFIGVGVVGYQGVKNWWFRNFG